MTGHRPAMPFIVDHQGRHAGVIVALDERDQARLEGTTSALARDVDRVAGAAQ
jgi:hypothetical protein